VPGTLVEAAGGQLAAFGPRSVPARGGEVDRRGPFGAGLRGGGALGRRWRSGRQEAAAIGCPHPGTAMPLEARCRSTRSQTDMASRPLSSRRRVSCSSPGAFCHRDERRLDSYEERTCRSGGAARGAAAAGAAAAAAIRSLRYPQPVKQRVPPDDLASQLRLAGAQPPVTDASHSTALAG